MSEALTLPVKVVFEDDTEAAISNNTVELGPFNLGVVVETARIKERIFLILIDVATMEAIAETLYDTNLWLVYGHDSSYRKMFVTSA